MAGGVIMSFSREKELLSSQTGQASVITDDFGLNKSKSPHILSLPTADNYLAKRRAKLQTEM